MTANHHFRIHDVTAIIGIVAAIPAILFVTLNVLKYEVGLLPNMDIAAIHPAILLGGGMAAVLLNAWSILEFRVSRQDQQIWLSFGFTNRPWNIAVLGLSGVFLFVLIAYVVFENISHALGA